MGSQQNSHSQVTHKQATMKQTSTELDFIFKRSIFWRPSYIAVSAWLEHIPFAFWLVDTLKPRKIVELGTHYGSSYFSFCQTVAKQDLETECYAVDTWGGDEHAGQYGEEVYRHVSEHNQQHYSDFSTLVRSTFDQALERFPQGSIDLLHIDGLHTYEAVRHDFESWLPKLSDRAVVIMHDTNVRERDFGVFQFLDELKQQYPHFEFAHGHGLGVIGVGSEQPAEMASLYSLSGNASATRQVQEVFSRLGKACGYSWENGEIKRQMAALQENQQAEMQEAVEQQALERGRLAERITAQHHALKTLEETLAKRADQEVELAAQQKEISTLRAELAQLAQHSTDVQTKLTQCEQQRDQSLASQQTLETVLADTRQELSQIVTERDQVAQEKQSLLEQHAELQQQLHEQTLHLNEEAQRSAELTLALNKSNAVLTEYSHQFNAQQQQIDKQAADLAAAYKQQDELSQTLATEAAHWQQQQQVLTETHCQLQSQCDGLTADLEAYAGEITNLNQTLAERAQTIDKQSVELNQTRDQLVALHQRHQAEQAEAQQQLSQLNQSLSERFTEIATLTQWLEEREQSIVKVAEEHSAHQQTWHTEQTSLLQAQVKLQQQLTSLQQQAAQQQVHLETRVSELEKQNEGLEANITERFRELATMTRHTEHLTRELQQKDQQLQKAKDRAQNLKQTMSWKLTAPVRALGRTFKDSSASTPAATVSSAERIAESGLFDELWYLHRYPEVADSGLSAIEHFIQVGAEKGYSPSALFDTRWYLQTYTDVAQGTINPLLHYILHGKAEQRHCLPENMRK